MSIEISEEVNNALHIAKAIAKENSHPYFGPAHLLKGLLHKDISLFQQLEEWGEDSYFMDEWAEVRIESYPKGKITAEPSGDEAISQVFNEAENISLKLGRNSIEPISLLASLSTAGVGFNYEQLKTFPLSQQLILDKIQSSGNLAQIKGQQNGQTPHNQPPKGTILKYCIDLNEESLQKEGPSFIGREQELISLAEILCRKSKPNILITGEAGIGKTALVKGLAGAISRGDVPASLKNARIFELDQNALLAGSSYKGETEDRFRNLIKELSRYETPILFIDDFHHLFDKSLGLQGIINIIKAALAKRAFILIGATLTDEYRKKVEQDSSLIRWCEILPIEEPDQEMAGEIVWGSISTYAGHHQVVINEEVVKEAVKLSKRYIKERRLPDSAIDVLDRTMAALQFMHHMAPHVASNFSSQLDDLQEQEPEQKTAQLEKLFQNLLSSLNYLSLAQIDEDPTNENKQSVTEARIADTLAKIRLLENPEKVSVEVTHIAATISKICGIPAGKILSGERERLMGMEEHLQSRVIGQDQAVKALTDAILESRSGLSRPGQPIGSFFLLGPTGTGKTELARQLAEFLFQSSTAFIRFDMSEFKEEHSAALLYGAPPGYVGYEEGGLLVNKIRQQPYSVVLFDEIEKAHSSVFDIFLQILDEGRIHDKLGRQGDFSNAVILFTSNIGSQHIVEMCNSGKGLPAQNELSNIMERYFRPEFLGRLSAIVPFAPIRKENVIKILKLQLIELENSLAAQGIELNISDLAADKIASEGYSPEYGARPLRTVIRTHLKTPLSRMIISGQLSPADAVLADINENGEISLVCQSKELTQL